MLSLNISSGLLGWVMMVLVDGFVVGLGVMFGVLV